MNGVLRSITNNSKLETVVYFRRYSFTCELKVVVLSPARSVRSHAELHMHER